jgi:hypothetical protein
MRPMVARLKVERVGIYGTLLRAWDRGQEPHLSPQER